MFTILEQSDKGKLRNFRTLTWKSSNTSSNTLTETFWSIRTNVRMHLFIEYLKFKHLMGTTNLLEQRCLYDAPNVLNDNLYFDALRGKEVMTDKKVFWSRLRILQKLEMRTIWSKNLFYTWDGTLTYSIQEIRRTIRKVKKYSGYVRTPSSVGSKRGNFSHTLIPESFEWNLNVEKDYFQFLTVGEFLNDFGNAVFSLTSPREDETVF